jgi:hypothetical protein
MSSILLIFLVWIFFEFFLNWVLSVGIFEGVQGAAGLFIASFLISYGLLGYLIFKILNFRGNMFPPFSGKCAQFLTFLLVLVALFLPTFGLLYVWIFGVSFEKFMCPSLAVVWITSACQGVANKLPSIVINLAALVFVKLLVAKVWQHDGARH